MRLQDPTVTQQSPTASQATYTTTRTASQATCTTTRTASQATCTTTRTASQATTSTASQATTAHTASLTVIPVVPVVLVTAVMSDIHALAVSHSTVVLARLQRQVLPTNPSCPDSDTSTSHRLYTITNSTSRRPLTRCTTNTLAIVFVHFSQVCICYTHVKDAMYKIETCLKERFTI